MEANSKRGPQMACRMPTLHEWYLIGYVRKLQYGDLTHPSHIPTPQDLYDPCIYLVRQEAIKRIDNGNSLCAVQREFNVDFMQLSRWMKLADQIIDTY